MSPDALYVIYTILLEQSKRIAYALLSYLSISRILERALSYRALILPSRTNLKRGDGASADS